MIKMIQWYRSYHTYQEVEGIQLTRQNVHEVSAWCNGVEVEELDPFNTSEKFVGVNVPTRGGNKRLSEGQWLIKDAQNNFSVLGDIAFNDEYNIT